MSIAALIRNMAEAGATPEAIALAVEAIEAVEAKVEAGRAAARERKRRQRANGRDGHVTVTGQGRDGHDAPSLPLPPSPQTPQPPTPTHPDITPRARKGGSSADFDAFWRAYPRKVAKDAATKAFAKAVRRITDPDPLAVILAGIERAMPGWDDPQFIPHPSTWLNRGSWEDEAPTPANPAQRARNERPDSHRPSKLDHLDDIARAMAASRNGAVEPDRGDRFDPGAESRGRYLPPAA